MRPLTASLYNFSRECHRHWTSLKPRKSLPNTVPICNTLRAQYGFVLRERIDPYVWAQLMAEELATRKGPMWWEVLALSMASKSWEPCLA